jgi:hypothetical protein
MIYLHHLIHQTEKNRLSWMQYLMLQLDKQLVYYVRNYYHCYFIDFCLYPYLFDRSKGVKSIEFGSIVTHYRGKLVLSSLLFSLSISNLYY